MTIVVTCREVDNYEREIKVYALFFNPESRAFSVSLCMGDMWGMELTCPLEISPISVEFLAADKATVRLDRHVDAEAFVAWLIEGEERVQRGFETMRG